MEKFTESEKVPLAINDKFSFPFRRNARNCLEAKKAMAELLMLHCTVKYDEAMYYLNKYL